MKFLSAIAKDIPWAAPVGFLSVQFGLWVNYLPNKEEIVRTILLSLLSFVCLLIWKRGHAFLKFIFKKR